MPAGRLGADVCHMNLHKTFCIPHGGGGPAWDHLRRQHLRRSCPATRGRTGRRREAIGPVSAAPWGSTVILPISWAYIA